MKLFLLGLVVGLCIGSGVAIKVAGRFDLMHPTMQQHYIEEFYEARNIG